MHPIQVVLSGNLKKHKAVHVCFYDVEWNCTEERETSLRKPSPFTLLPDKVSHSFITQWTCTELLCALPVPGAHRWWRDAYQNSQAGRDMWTNPLHMPPQGQQKRQGRTVTQESSWFTHRRAKRYQRRLPGGGNPRRGANPQLKHKQDTEAWIYKQCNLAPPSRDTTHDRAGWTGVRALLLVPSSRILKL